MNPTQATPSDQSVIIDYTGLKPDQVGLVSSMISAVINDRIERLKIASSSTLLGIRFEHLGAANANGNVLGATTVVLDDGTALIKMNLDTMNFGNGFVTAGSDASVPFTAELLHEINHVYLDKFISDSSLHYTDGYSSAEPNAKAIAATQEWLFRAITLNDQDRILGKEASEDKIMLASMASDLLSFDIVKSSQGLRELVSGGSSTSIISKAYSILMNHDINISALLGSDFSQRDFDYNHINTSLSGDSFRVSEVYVNGSAKHNTDYYTGLTNHAYGTDGIDVSSWTDNSTISPNPSYKPTQPTLTNHLVHQPSSQDSLGRFVAALQSDSTASGHQLPIKFSGQSDFFIVDGQGLYLKEGIKVEDIVNSDILVKAQAIDGESTSSTLHLILPLKLDIVNLSPVKGDDLIVQGKELKIADLVVHGGDGQPIISVSPGLSAHNYNKADGSGSALGLFLNTSSYTYAPGSNSTIPFDVTVADTNTTASGHGSIPIANPTSGAFVNSMPYGSGELIYNSANGYYLYQIADAYIFDADKSDTTSMTISLPNTPFQYQDIQTQRDPYDHSHFKVYIPVNHITGTKDASVTLNMTAKDFTTGVVYDKAVFVTYPSVTTFWKAKATPAPFASGEPGDMNGYKVASLHSGDSYENNVYNPNGIAHYKYKLVDDSGGLFAISGSEIVAPNGMSQADMGKHFTVETSNEHGYVHLDSYSVYESYIYGPQHEIVHL